MFENSYAEPYANIIDLQEGSTEIEEIAKAQRMFLLSILANFVVGILMKTGALVGLALAPVALGIAIFSIWCVYRLCKSLSMGSVLWVIAMFIPIINVIFLLVLNQKATRYLKNRGIEVGLLGAKV
jgi:hypothetical protein